MNELWAIKHVPTGNFLLQRQRLRGGTKEEPEPWTEKRHPRLFPNAANAKRALTAWLSGRWQDGYFDTIDGPDYDAGPAPTPVATRKREEMQIVRFVLREKK